MGNGPTVTLIFDGDADRLSRTMDQVTRGSKRMADGVGSASDAMESRSKKMSNTMKAGLATGATAIAGFAVAGVAKLVEVGRSLEALDLKAKTVFGDQLPLIQRWADENRKAFGVSSREAVNMAASMTDLLKPMGFNTKQATKMTTEMLDLAGALSRWSGGSKSAAEVSDILSDALLGEADALKGLGINLSAADVQARIVKKGQDDLTGAARAQAEAIATQELIMERSTDAQKAWADGGKEAAEAQNALSSNIAESTEKLASIVAPLYEKFVQFLAKMVEWISKNQEVAIAIGVVTAAIWLLNAALNANPIVLIITLIGGLIVAFIALWNKSAAFRDFWKGVWNVISGVVGTVVGTVKRIWNGLVDFFTKTPLGRIVTRIFAGIGAAIGAVVSAIGWVIQRIRDFIDFASSAYRAAERVIGIAPTGSIKKGPGRAFRHTGGYVPGMLGSEQLMVLQAGERVIPRGQSGNEKGGGTALGLVVSGNADQLAAGFIQGLVRTHALNLRVDSSGRVVVA